MLLTRFLASLSTLLMRGGSRWHRLELRVNGKVCAQVGRAIMINIVPVPICAGHAPDRVNNSGAARVPGVRAYPGRIGKITREIDQFRLLSLRRCNMLFYADHCNRAVGRNRRNQGMRHKTFNNQPPSFSAKRKSARLPYNSDG